MRPETELTPMEAPASAAAVLQVPELPLQELAKALQAHPCKADEDKLLLGHLSWPWSLDRDKLFIILAPSLLRV